MEATENKQNLSEQLGEQSQVAAGDSSSVIDFKMVTFALAGKDYAIDIMHVKEIAKAGSFTYVPNTLPFVLGVYNLRGDIIPILDLRLFFNISVPARTDNKLENLLILTIEDQTFGVVVDKIDKVVGVQRSTIQPPHPLCGDINIKYIQGVVESNKHLYVLLDITRIFSTKSVTEDVQANKANVYKENFKANSISSGVNGSSNADSRFQNAAPKASETTSASSVDLKFLSESLQNYKNFTVSELNADWVSRRFNEWKNSGKSLIQNEEDADKFLSSFWSPYNNEWWNKPYADEIASLLPDNNAKQIIVWNPGCGKGCESYSLACVLLKRYPGAKIRIYAQDIDLLPVSNASLMTIPDNLASSWYAEFLTRKATGEYTFNQNVKDSIMFEYHDCKNTNALPMCDVIFARDVLSLLDKDSQDFVLADFVEKLKGNAIAIVGANEQLPSSYGFGENTVGALTAYYKE